MSATALFVIFLALAAVLGFTLGFRLETGKKSRYRKDSNKKPTP